MFENVIDKFRSEFLIGDVVPPAQISLGLSIVSNTLIYINEKNPFFRWLYKGYS